MQMHNPPHPGEFIDGVYLEPCALSIRQRWPSGCNVTTTSGKPVSDSIFQG